MGLSWCEFMRRVSWRFLLLMGRESIDKVQDTVGKNFSY
jgi:hypothetical protein